MYQGSSISEVMATGLTAGFRFPEETRVLLATVPRQAEVWSFIRWVPGNSYHVTRWTEREANQWHPYSAWSVTFTFPTRLRDSKQGQVDMAMRAFY